MPAVFKRKGLPNWYARFMVDGKGYCISTGKCNKKEALKILKQKRIMIKEDVTIDSHFDQLLQLINKLPKRARDVKRREFVRALMSAVWLSITIGECANPGDLWQRADLMRPTQAF